MNMLISLATIVSLFICVNSIHLQLNEFTNNFQDVCYTKKDELAQPLPLFLTKWNRAYTTTYAMRGDIFRNGPMSMSVESLIGLIEKIENNAQFKRKNYRAKDLAMLLLRKYRIDDLEFGNGLFAMRNDMKVQYAIEKAVLDIDDNTINTADIDNILDNDENCTMHFLLSHNIDIVAKNGDKNALPFRVQGSQPLPARANEFKPRFSVSSLPKNTQITKRPREYGVGTFRQNKEQAIALNKLLLGVVAGLSDNQPQTVAELYQRTNPSEPLTDDLKLDVKSTVDPIMAVTFAGILSYGAYTDEQITQNLFGAKGEWNTSLCAIEYNLETDKDINDIKDIRGVAITKAELRGAVDGYGIAKALKDISSSATNVRSKSELRLSQILRFYYSPTGFEPSTTQYGYCKRKYSINQNEVKQNAQAFERLSILLKQGPVKVPDTLATAPIEKVSPEFFKELDEAKNLPDDDNQWCNEDNGGIGSTNNIDDAPCETRSDVIVMIDQLADDENLEYQREFIDNLAREMDLSKYGSTLTILASSENVTSPDKTLYKISWDEYNKGCATCRLAYTDYNEFQQFFNTQKFVEILNDTLAEFEVEKQFEKAIPSRTFIIMNFRDLASGKVNINAFNNARNQLEIFHRNTRFLVVSNKNEYDYLIKERQKDFFSKENEDVKETVKKVLKRICETPATFQHQECNLKSSQSVEITQYITPGAVQHWAMYPLHFLKSYRMTFTFRAEKGKIQVCNSRDPKPGFQENRNYCQDNKNSEEITFIRDNPCHKFDRVTCAPVYFSVFAIDTSDNNPLCKSENCGNLKQIPFTFTHTGVSCNNAFGVAFSPFMITFTVLTAFISNLKIKF